MSDARQPIPSPILGIVGLVVAAGLIILVMNQRSGPNTPPANKPPADSSTQPPGGDPSKPTDTGANPGIGTGTTPGTSSGEPNKPSPAPEPPPSTPPKPALPSPADLASLDAKSLAAALATVPAADRKALASQALLVAAARPGTPADLVPTLRSADADINAADGEGRTPLMLASAAANLDVVFALLDSGAAVWTKDTKGMDAREHALARNDQAGYDVAAVLEDAAPD